jgi:hypothetical protein
MRIYVHQETKHEAEAVDTSGAVTIAEALGIIGNEEVVVLLEDQDEALDVTLTLEGGGVSDRAHVFCGPRSRIEVVVSFNGERKEHEFAASARVDRVFRWATGEHGFHLSKADSAEHTLALAGSDVIPAGDVHLGSLDEKTPGHVAFSLIPKHRYEG